MPEISLLVTLYLMVFMLAFGVTKVLIERRITSFVLSRRVTAFCDVDDCAHEPIIDSWNGTWVCGCHL